MPSLAAAAATSISTLRSTTPASSSLSRRSLSARSASRRACTSSLMLASASNAAWYRFFPSFTLSCASRTASSASRTAASACALAVKYGLARSTARFPNRPKNADDSFTADVASRVFFACANSARFFIVSISVTFVIASDEATINLASKVPPDGDAGDAARCASSRDSNAAKAFFAAACMSCARSYVRSASIDRVWYRFASATR